MDAREQNPTLISSAVVVNIIWWMVMIAAIGIGAMHLGSCPIQPKIPIYLIVLGVSNILSLSLTYIQRLNSEGTAQCLVTTSVTLLYFFTFCWLITGSVWVYAVYVPNSAGADNFCHKITYQFAFVVTTIVWVLLSLMFLCGGCFLLLCSCKLATHRLPFMHSTFYGETSDFQPRV
ncbi:hypothetical protein LDENG_00078190 [Lucifuga dentata]|nr:hypothetical protein LDENG_00078190 [Lucifuga dentata]